METITLSAESAHIFHEGLGLILSRWSALTTAVENECGGRDSRAIANILCSDVFSYFTDDAESGEYYIEDLLDILHQNLLRRNMKVEYSSIEEVAGRIMIMFDECLQDIYRSVENLRTSTPPPVAHVRLLEMVYSAHMSKKVRLLDINNLMYLTVFSLSYMKL
ncbi:Pre-rRNA-processing protein TSR2 [Corchorus capsularis]|uniref:Pre-rRNA-processing protein TSR2 n=1 Tax=Corchorus capsularis TaxID=210143 RepID=A0A1R3HU63_COCAP|nr:Pre-rRNA-processing protein TSR2 [Corchorus capsularis]